MQTLTINVDDSYLDQILNFLQNIPKNKREIFHHQKIDISNNKPNKTKNDSTISEEEAKEWKKNINSGYKSWKIEEF